MAGIKNNPDKIQNESGGTEPRVRPTSGTIETVKDVETITKEDYSSNNLQSPNQQPPSATAKQSPETNNNRTTGGSGKNPVGQKQEMSDTDRPQTPGQFSEKTNPTSKDKNQGPEQYNSKSPKDNQEEPNSAPEKAEEPQGKPEEAESPANESEEEDGKEKDEGEDPDEDDGDDKEDEEDKPDDDQEDPDEQTPEGGQDDANNSPANNEASDAQDGQNGGSGEEKGANDRDGANNTGKQDEGDENNNEDDKEGGEDGGWRGKLGRGINKVKRAKQIAEDPVQAAKEIAKQKAKKIIKKQLAALAARSGLTGFLAANWPIILIVLAVIILIIFIIAIVSIFSFSASNTEDAANKQNISNIEAAVESGKMSFVTTGDIDSIKTGTLSAPSLQAFNYLLGNHKSVKINYSPNAEITNTSANSASALRSNSPFEFDVAALDKIKCADSGGQKIKEFDINLATGFNWNEYLQGQENPGSIICAVGYYPGLEDKTSTSALDKYGPGEFHLSDITTAGTQAAHAKILEAAGEIIDNKDSFRIESSDAKSVVPAIISTSLNENDAIYQEIENQIAAANQGDSVKFYAKSDTTMPYGLHIEFFNELTDENP